MRKLVMSVICMISAVMVSVVSAQTIINTDFAGYVDGDLAGQNDWLALTGTGLGTPAFEVTNQTAISGMATNASTGLDFYVYLNNTPAGNDVDDEWDGIMDFTMNWTSPGWRHGAYFSIGTSTTLSNALEGVDADDVALAVRTDWPDILRIGSWDASGAFQEILMVTAADLGMDPGSADLDSDNLQLTWNVRKTRTPDTYAITASLKNVASNITHSGSTVTIVKPDAYAATTPYYMLGHNKGFGWWDGSQQYWKHLTIDSLSLSRSTGNLPVLTAPVVAALGGDNVVNLAWPSVADAESYDVERATSAGGPWDAPVNVLVPSYADTSVTAGTEYFYRVSAKATGAADATSDVVSAIPFSGGAFIDTSFAASDAPAYANGDLAGQNGWAELIASLPGAFEVDSSGSGFASTVGLTATGGVHQVYYTSPTSNDVTATWSGTVVFSLSTSPDGIYKTNITAGVTNVYEVAELGSGYQTFMFGLTSNPGTDLDPSDGDAGAGGDDDVLIGARVGGNDGRLDISINNYNWAENIMLALDRSQIGWDPNGYDINSTNAPDFNTDTITLDYVIRKSPDNQAYMGTCTATVNGVIYEGRWQTTANDSNWGKPTAVWSEPFVYFGMSRGAADAQKQVDVTIDLLSVAYSPVSDPVILAPENLGSALGNLEVTINWDNYGEETGFNVYRSETNGGSYILVGSAASNETSYTDTGLTDLRSYFYKVSGQFAAGESAPSAPIVVRALGRTLHLEWGGAVTMSSGNNWATGRSAATVAGGLNYWEGAGVEPYSMIGSADTWYANPPHPDLKGIIQAPTNSAFDANRPNVELRWNTGARFRFADGASALYWVDCPSIDNTVLDVSGEWDKFQWYCFPAIRNGTNWYVAQSALNTDRSLDLGDELWTTVKLATATDTELMVREGTYATGDSIGFNDINAFGFFAENAASGNDAWVSYMRLLYGSSPTPYQSWCDSQGIYNDDTGSSLDLDGDGVNNLTEWGLGGDPLDPADTGITERYQGMDASGNLLYIHPKREAAGPAYIVTETSDLVYGTFGVPAIPYVSTVGGAWPGEPGFVAVTNVVPTTEPLKFIQLEIQ